MSYSKYSQEDLKKMLEEENKRIKTLQKKLDDLEPMSKTESGLRGTIQGFTLDSGDEIGAGAQALAESGVPCSFSLFHDKFMTPSGSACAPAQGGFSWEKTRKTYNKEVKESRKKFKKAFEDNPKSYIAGDVGGSLVTGFVPVPGTKVAAGLKLKKLAELGKKIDKAGRLVKTSAKVGKVAAKGGLQGAAVGYGQSEAENSKDILKDIGEGALYGSGTSLGMKGLGKAAKGSVDLVKKIPKTVATKVLDVPKEAVDKYWQDPKRVDAAVEKLRALKNRADEDDIDTLVTDFRNKQKLLDEATSEGSTEGFRILDKIEKEYDIKVNIEQIIAKLKENQKKLEISGAAPSVDTTERAHKSIKKQIKWLENLKNTPERKKLQEVLDGVREHIQSNKTFFQLFKNFAPKNFTLGEKQYKGLREQASKIEKDLESIPLTEVKEKLLEEISPKITERRNFAKGNKKDPELKAYKNIYNAYDDQLKDLPDYKDLMKEQAKKSAFEEELAKKYRASKANATIGRNLKSNVRTKEGKEDLDFLGQYIERDKHDNYSQFVDDVLTSKEFDKARPQGSKRAVIGTVTGAVGGPGAAMAGGFTGAAADKSGGQWVRSIMRNSKPFMEAIEKKKEKMGKFYKPLMNAYNKGNKELALLHSILLLKNPEYQAAIESLE